MIFSRVRVTAVSTAAIVAMLAAGAPPAAAQNLFEMLFKNNRAGRTQQEAPPPAAEPAPVHRAAPPRVSGPQYYTYKTDPLVRVDFAAITLKPDGDDDAAMAAPDGVDPSSV